MSERLTINRRRHLRTTRGVAVVLLMLTYLFSSALHGVLDVHPANAFGKAVVMTSAEKTDGPAEKGIVGEHHCHGCFSVLVSLPMIVADLTRPESTRIQEPQSVESNLSAGIDTPPPKILI